MQHTTTTLESIFGVAPGGQREVVETPFEQEARAIVLSPHVLATVAHALIPKSVAIHRQQQANIRTIPLSIKHMDVTAYPVLATAGVPVHIAHLNESYDLALIQASPQQRLLPFPYPAALSYGSGDPGNPVGGLRAGDCIAAVVPIRDTKGQPTGSDRLVTGKVLARGPVATSNMTQTQLNVNMFTTDIAMEPGDSGSPVLALRNGKPVLVGLVSATMYPTALFTYVTRIDPLLALAEALQIVGTDSQQLVSDTRLHTRETAKPWPPRP
jgi:hypothetical protein